MFSNSLEKKRPVRTLCIINQFNFNFVLQMDILKLHPIFEITPTEVHYHECSQQRISNFFHLFRTDDVTFILWAQLGISQDRNNHKLMYVLRRTTRSAGSSTQYRRQCWGKWVHLACKGKGFRWISLLPCTWQKVQQDFL